MFIDNHYQLEGAAVLEAPNSPPPVAPGAGVVAPGVVAGFAVPAALFPNSPPGLENSDVGGAVLVFAEPVAAVPPKGPPPAAVPAAGVAPNANDFGALLEDVLAADAPNRLPEPAAAVPKRLGVAAAPPVPVAPAPCCWLLWLAVLPKPVNPVKAGGFDIDESVEHRVEGRGWRTSCVGMKNVIQA